MNTIGVLMKKKYLLCLCAVLCIGLSVTAEHMLHTNGSDTHEERGGKMVPDDDCDLREEDLLTLDEIDEHLLAHPPEKRKNTFLKKLILAVGTRTPWILSLGLYVTQKWYTLLRSMSKLWNSAQHRSMHF